MGNPRICVTASICSASGPCEMQGKHLCLFQLRRVFLLMLLLAIRGGRISFCLCILVAQRDALTLNSQILQTVYFKCSAPGRCRRSSVPCHARLTLQGQLYLPLSAGQWHKEIVSALLCLSYILLVTCSFDLVFSFPCIYCNYLI